MNTLFMYLVFTTFLVVSFLTSFSVYGMDLYPCKLDEKNNHALSGAECGVMRLPENWEKYASKETKRVDVHVMKIPAIKEEQAPPIFFVAGGPGQAASDIALLIRLSFPRLLTNHDFIFVDQRGTGKSSPLKCDLNEDSFMDLAPEESEKKAIAAIKQCISETDADLRFYTTYYAVKDLEAVRQALGYGKINLWGASYGTRVALEYMRQSPESINKVVLDGAAPMQMTMPNYMQEDASNALKTIFASCQQQKNCKNAFGSLEEKWLTLLNKLEESPQIISLSHPRTLKPEKVYLDNNVLSNAIRPALYSSEFSTLLPLTINKAVDGDFTPLASLLLISMDNFSGINQLMHYSVICGEDFPIAKKQDTPIFPHNYSDLLVSDSAVNLYKKVCTFMPEPMLTEGLGDKVVSDIPTLIFSGEFDPVTPPRWGEWVASSLSHAEHVIAKSGHHGISRSACGPELIQNFFSVNATHVDSACMKKMAPPAYFIDSAGPALREDIPTSTTAPSSDTQTPQDVFRGNSNNMHQTPNAKENIL